MSKLSEYCDTDHLEDIRSDYTAGKSHEGRYTKRDLMEGINDLVKERSVEYPDYKIVGVDNCSVSFKSMNGVPKVEVRFSVKAEYEKDGPTHVIYTALETTAEYISDLGEDLDEYFDGQEEKETKA